MNQLRDDLRKQLQRRFDLWMGDAGKLYQMAGLAAAACVLDIVGIIVTQLVHISTELQVEPRGVAQMVYDTMIKAEQIKRKERPNADASTD